MTRYHLSSGLLQHSNALTRLTDDVLHHQLQGDLQGVCSDFPPTNLSLSIRRSLLFLFFALLLYSITTHGFHQVIVYVFAFGYEKHRGLSKYLTLNRGYR